MSKMLNITFTVVIFCSVLAFSACSTQPQEAAVAEPAPAAMAEEPVAPPAPPVIAESPTSKPVVKKARKRRVKAAPVEPVVVPAPVVAEPEPVATPKPAPPAPVAAPEPKFATPGFLEQYWMWLLGFVLVVVAFLVLKKRS